MSESNEAKETLIEAYRAAQDLWSSQCFCFTSAPEQMRRDAHAAARDGYNELVRLLGTVVRPWLDEEYRAAEAEARREREHRQGDR